MNRLVNKILFSRLTQKQKLPARAAIERNWANQRLGSPLETVAVVQDFLTVVARELVKLGFDILPRFGLEGILDRFPVLSDKL